MIARTPDKFSDSRVKDVVSNVPLAEFVENLEPSSDIVAFVLLHEFFNKFTESDLLGSGFFDKAAGKQNFVEIITLLKSRKALLELLKRVDRASLNVSRIKFKIIGILLSYSKFRAAELIIGSFDKVEKSNSELLKTIISARCDDGNVSAFLRQMKVTQPAIDILPTLLKQRLFRLLNSGPLIPGTDTFFNKAKKQKSLVYPEISTGFLCLDVLQQLHQNPYIVKRKGFGKQDKRSNDAKIIFCTNASYFIGTMVALLSLRIFQSALSGCDIFVYYNGKDFSSKSAVIDRFKRKLGLRIKFVNGTRFLKGIAAERQSYGFKAINSLDLTAFLRIFAANDLTDNYPVLYFDSDIMFTHNEFLVDLERKCAFQARLEPQSPDVRYAANQIGVRSGSYFNSGVFVYNKIYDQDGCMEKTIKTVMDASQKLVFHDQCALNIGFHKHSKEIAIEHNYPHRPTDILKASPRASLVHFVESPKPWSQFYSNEYSVPYRLLMDVCKSFIGNEEFSRILSEATA